MYLSGNTFSVFVEPQKTPFTWCSYVVWHTKTPMSLCLQRISEKSTLNPYRERQDITHKLSNKHVSLVWCLAPFWQQYDRVLPAGFIIKSISIEAYANFKFSLQRTRFKMTLLIVMNAYSYFPCKRGLSKVDGDNG